MKVDIGFKSEKGPEYQSRLRREFRSDIDGRLVAMLLAASFYMLVRFGVLLIITGLMRTKQENKDAGGKAWSAHLFGRGVDIRTFNLKEEQIEALIKYLQDTWGDMLFIKRHDSGSGDHLHINIRYEYRNP